MARTGTSHSGRTPGVLTALRVYCLLLLGLYLLAPLFGETAAWGLWPVTYLPPAGRWLLAGLAALTCAAPVADRLWRGGVWLLSRARMLAARLGIPATPRAKRLGFLVASLLCLLPFLFLHIVHTRWGDAYILVNGIAWPDPALRLTVSWQAPLTVWLHARLWAAGNALFVWPDAWPVYRIVSPLAGVLFVYLLLRLADSIGRNGPQKLLIAGLVGTLGTMQLFFGYAENYTLAAVGVLLFLWFALEAIHGRRALWQPALALAVTNGLHPSTIVLAPALLLAAWMWIDQQRRAGAAAAGRRALWQVALPMAAVAAGVVLLMQLSGHGPAALVTTDRPGGGDARWFVPLTGVSTRWEHYTMFSWAHLRDWLNEQMLTAPVTLGGLAIVGGAMLLDWGRSRGAPARKGNGSQPGEGVDRDELRFLAACTGLYWLFTVVWNPDYGGQRDWDLFSLAAIPSTLLLARLLPRALPGRAHLAQAAVMLTVVSAMHTMAWIYQNTLPWEWP